MKKASLLLLIFVYALSTQAQNYVKKTPEEKARKYTDELIAQISLEKEQEEKIFLINVNVSKQFDSLYAAKADKDEMRKAYGVIFKSRDAEFKKVLTKEQFLRYDDWQREKREQRLKEKAEKEKQSQLVEKENK
jgi:protein CpxP